MFLHNYRSETDLQIDVTYESGPAIIMRTLSDDAKARYLRPGYRFRIVK